jgi:O-antigen ligase
LAQAVDTVQRPPSVRGVLPALSLALLGSVVGVGMAVVGPVAVLPLFGLLFFGLVAMHPEYGIALFLSTFLVTYPGTLQGSGSLTINNLMGGIFLILLSYKMYRERDWWFLRVTELRLLGFICLVSYLANRFNGPDPRLLALLGVIESAPLTSRTFLSRSIFTLFFVNFIRTPWHVMMIYSIGVIFMIGACISGVQGMTQGTALHGYRAVSAVISAAANPNRLAIFALMSIAALWYLMRWWRAPVLPVVVLPLIAVMALAVFMTGSRSGLLGLCVCVVAIAIDEGLGVRQLVGAALVGALTLILVAQLVPEKTYDRLTNLPFTEAGETGLGSSSLGRRREGWRQAFKMFEQHPVIGIGIGNWQLARFLSDPTRDTTAPHSSYVLAAVEGGIISLAAFLVLLWRTWRNFRYAESYVSDPDSPLSNMQWVVKGGRVSFLVLVLFSVFADLWQFVALFWLVGLGIVLRRLVDQTALEAALGKASG